MNKSELTSYLDRGDGACVHYVDNQKKCGIYHDRPLICRVDDFYGEYLKGIPIEIFYEENQKVCNQLQAVHSRQHLEIAWQSL